MSRSIHHFRLIGNKPSEGYRCDGCRRVIGGPDELAEASRTPCMSCVPEDHPGLISPMYNPDASMVIIEAGNPAPASGLPPPQPIPIAARLRGQLNEPNSDATAIALQALDALDDTSNAPAADELEFLRQWRRLRAVESAGVKWTLEFDTTEGAETVPFLLDIYDEATDWVEPASSGLCACPAEALRLALDAYDAAKE